jgi:hypothetical protein
LNCYDYLEASRSRIQTARILHNDSQYAAAIYFAGVAIESLLRAFVTRDDPEFDERHDLRELYKRSQIVDLIGPDHQRRAGEWLGDVWSRWKNNYRFASNDRLRAEFRNLKHNPGIKGDYLKKNSNIALDSALSLWTLGERKWHSKKN